MTEQLDAVVVGGGQAGLAVSRELGLAGVDHAVLERARIGESWRDRWDSFCLVTPNWSVRMPGHPYDGSDPDGFMPRDDIVAYLERYAAAVGAPVREGVEVRSLGAATRGRPRARHPRGADRARAVVVCTGAYQRPHRPAAAATLPGDLLQLDVDDYRHPAALPAGAVLVVGSGQSGCQVAEELHMAGREVVLACGRAPWLPRRFGGRDLMWWVLETGFMDQGVTALPSPEARLFSNVLATGAGGGHDLHLRTLQALGVRLAGRFEGAEDHTARFAPDLDASVAWGDARHGQLIGLCRKLVAERGLPPLDVPEPEPFASEPIESVDLRRFGAVVFAGGFRPGYTSWIRFPEAFDADGFPIQRDGASTVVDGLYFAGVHFLRKRKSSIFAGVGEDAAIVAGDVAARLSPPAGSRS